MSVVARTARATAPVRKILTGSVVGQGLVLLSAPLITLLYAPGDLGTLAVVTSLSAILGSVVTLGWERAIMLPRASAQADALILLATASTIAVSGVVFVVLLVARHAVATWLSAPALVSAFWIVPLCSAMVGSQRIVGAVLARRQAYASMGFRNVSQGAVQVAATIALAPLGGGLGLLLGPPLGRAAALVSLRAGRDHARGSRRRRLAILRRALAQVRPTARRFRTFPLLSTWSGALNSAGLQAPVLTLAAIYGSVEMGLVSLAIRVITAPVSIVAEGVGQYADGRLGRAAREGTSMRPFIARLSGSSTIVGAFAAAIVVAGAPLAVPALFGEAWRGAGVFAQIFAVTAAAQLAVAPVARTLTFLQRPGAQLAWDSLRLVATCGAILLASALQGDTVVAVGSWAAASVVSYGALLVTVLAATGRRDRSALPSSHV